MRLMKSMAPLAILSLMASSAAGSPSLAAFLRLRQEVPCKVCVLTTPTFHYSPTPACWQSTSFVSQSTSDGYCGPGPDCASQGCSFDVTITVTSNSSCTSMTIRDGSSGQVKASCTTCSSLAWNSGEIGLDCNTSPPHTYQVYEVLVNGQLVDVKSFICNICQ